MRPARAGCSAVSAAREMGGQHRATVFPSGTLGRPSVSIDRASRNQQLCTHAASPRVLEGTFMAYVCPMCLVVTASSVIWSQVEPTAISHTSTEGREATCHPSQCSTFGPSHQGREYH